MRSSPEKNISQTMQSESQSPTQLMSAVPWQTYAVLAVGLVAVSLAAILIRLAQAEGMSSLLISAARLGIAALILTPVTLRRYQKHLRAISRSEWLLITVSGVVLAFHFIAWTLSLEYTTVLISVVLVTTSPLWSAVLEVVFLRTHLHPVVVWGLLIAIGGGVMISVPGEGDTLALGSNPVLGGVLAIGGAVSFAIYMVIGQKIRARMPVIPYIWLVYGIAAIAASVVVLATRTAVAGFSVEGYGWLLATALVPQLIGHSAFNYAVEHVSATYIGIATQLEPVGSAILAFFAFREVPRALQIAGSAIILVGLMLASLGQHRSFKAED
jgi:drug/metabolite transporter (DMT)-like permease